MQNICSIWKFHSSVLSRRDDAVFPCREAKIRTQHLTATRHIFFHFLTVNWIYLVLRGASVHVTCARGISWPHHGHGGQSPSPIPQLVTGGAWSRVGFRVQSPGPISQLVTGVAWSRVGVQSPGPIIQLLCWCWIQGGGREVSVGEELPWNSSGFCWTHTKWLSALCCLHWDWDWDAWLYFGEGRGKRFIVVRNVKTQTATTNLWIFGFGPQLHAELWANQLCFPGKRPAVTFFLSFVLYFFLTFLSVQLCMQGPKRAFKKQGGQSDSSVFHGNRNHRKEAKR